jgi:hypothetical protein
MLAGIASPRFWVHVRCQAGGIAGHQLAQKGSVMQSTSRKTKVEFHAKAWGSNIPN